eukprot:TRINITY_DN113_c0_g1_i1.p1 TRINITY_DN113_c0_g1~~TRINITY_DN113_c0_g1_i1.p1  ORF type:complete len:140 (+),score=41.99 TRINITY_DN113_c0_g1_i1:41-421(+)
MEGPRRFPNKESSQLHQHSQVDSNLQNPIDGPSASQLVPSLPPPPFFNDNDNLNEVEDIQVQEIVQDIQVQERIQDIQVQERIQQIHQSFQLEQIQQSIQAEETPISDFGSNTFQLQVQNNEPTFT